MWRPVLRRMTALPGEHGPASDADANKHLNEHPELARSGPRVQSGQPGLTLTVTNAPPSWRFVNPQNPVRDPTHPDFTRLPGEGSVMHASEADLDRCLDVVASCANEVLERAEADNAAEFWLGEAEDWRKVTVQRGGVMGRILVELGPPQVEPDDAWRVMARRLLRAYREKLVRIEVPPSPFGTNAGFPAYSQGWAAKMVSALLGMGSTANEIEDDSVRFCMHAGLPNATAQAYGLSWRQGPLYKSQPYYAHAGGGLWAATFAAKGHWSRSRQVFMGSFGNTVALRDLFAFLQGGRRGMRGLWHGGTLDRDAIMAAEAAGLHFGESDISGYDLSVPHPLQLALADAIGDVMPSLRAAAFIWAYYECRPVLCPSWTLDRGYTLVTTRGATHSGQRLTAEIGTLITTTTALVALSELLRHDALASWQRGELMLLVQGDDILVATAQPLDGDAWEAVWKRYNFKCSMLRSRRFLAKHRYGPYAYPVGGRIVQQTVSNEHEPPAGDGRDWDPILVLGLQSRWGHGPLPNVAALVQRCLKETALYNRTGVFDGPSATLWLNNSHNASRLQAVLASLASSPWMDRLRRDAPYSPAAAAMLETLESTVGVPEDAATVTKNAVLHNAIRNWLFRSSSDRFSYALKLWEAIQRGVTDEEAMLL